MEQDHIGQYVESLRPASSAALKNIETQLKADGKWGINIGSVEGTFLQFLVRAFGIKSILEIGTQYGYSTQWMVEALPADGRIVTLEKDSAHHEQAKKFVSDKRVSFILGDAVETLPKIKDSFDLIFIDANKSAYVDYLHWGEKMLKPGGFILGDNTFLFGTIFQESALAGTDHVSPNMWKTMRQFNSDIFANKAFDACIVPTGEGMTLARKKH